jgi:hypothetical protein
MGNMMMMMMMSQVKQCLPRHYLTRSNALCLLCCWRCHAAAMAAKQMLLLLLLLWAPLLPQLGPSEHTLRICNIAKLLCQLLLPIFPTQSTLLLLLCVFLKPFIYYVAWLLLPPPLQPLLLLAGCTCCLLDPVLYVAQLALAC